MSLRALIGKLLRQWPNTLLYKLCDHIYLRLDRTHVRRTRNICRIPHESWRRGGKYSYGEWGHVIGIFQTLIGQNLPCRSGESQILDVGCGTGLLAIAAEPYVQRGGQYVGVDVGKQDIDFCESHYDSSHFRFVHLDAANSEYAPDQSNAPARWPLENQSFDMVLALSVWTHMRETDATFYLREVHRVLKPQGKAIITFFVLDDDYEKLIASNLNDDAEFHNTPKSTWLFDQVSYGSNDFRHPSWADVPEAAIAIQEAGLRRIVAEAGLRIVQSHTGNWKEKPGVYFQDVLVLERES